MEHAGSVTWQEVACWHRRAVKTREGEGVSTEDGGRGEGAGLGNLRATRGGRLWGAADLN